MTVEADTVNAWSSGYGDAVAAFRVNEEWQEIRISVDDAELLAGMLHLIVRNTRNANKPTHEV